MTEVFYLGNKPEMFAHGYDFSFGSVDVPDTDTGALEKFKGNRFFHVSGAVNCVAPAFWVCPILRVMVKNDDLGKPVYRTYKETVKLYPAKDMADAKAWIKQQGPRAAEGQTHWIMKNNEGISKPPECEATEGGDEEAGNEPSSEVTVAVFRKKEDGSPYSRPDKTFKGTDEDALRADAVNWMAQNQKKQGDHLIMAK